MSVLIKPTKAASVVMAAFLLSACDTSQEMFFDVAGASKPIWFQHLMWFSGHPEIFIPLVLTITISIFLLFQKKSQRFAAFVERPFLAKITVPRLWFLGCLSFVLLMTIGFWYLTRPSIDTYLHDTYYVDAHFHFSIVIIILFGFFGLAYVVFEKAFKCSYNRVFAFIQFAVFYLGVFFLSVPQISLSLKGMPKRYVDYPEAFRLWNLVALIGGWLILISGAAFILVVIEALVKKRPIGDRGARIKRE